QLTEKVRRKPYSIVLFDEIEKAHPDVFNILLQILEDGRLTDGQGRVVNFKNTIIIMTSNIGSQLLGDADAVTADMKKKMQDELKKYFRPELINRLDEIIYFNKLNDTHIRKIVDLELRGIVQKLSAKKIRLALSDEAKDELGREGYDPVYGARPLRRLIQKQIQNPLAMKLLNGEIPEKSGVSVDFDRKAESFRFEVTAAKAEAAAA
ncbi:MAG: AAA family ATPase, partial [Candidatus Omnitrophica bacterium]|nr:AAA family ATPase [Candidatus Omnitrophota bacterium]